MRGRVGRTNKKALCYLLTPPLTTITDDARKRLKTIEEFSELGSGFNIAMRDLDIRGAGNLLGAEQSGFIAEMGFEMYHKILDEAIRELKESDFKEHFENEVANDHDYTGECVLETDLPLLIPTAYVESSSERFSLYKELDNIDSEGKLLMFRANLQDRFGPIPSETLGLFTALKLRWLARRLGFEKVVLKSGLFIGYFISSPDSPYYSSSMFSSIMQFAQYRARDCQIKETNNKLSITIKYVDGVEKAFEILDRMNLVSA